MAERATLPEMLRFLKSCAKAGLAFLVFLALVACGLHVANSGHPPVPPQPAGSLRVATWNVHYIVNRAGASDWNLADWDRRKAPLDLAFKAIDADLFALQESETFPDTNNGGPNLTLDYLLAQNPAYRAAAVGDAAEFPSTQPILYRPDRLTLVDQGWFFFSDTPDVIYSRTFNGSWPAFASWVEFEPLRGGPVFLAMNVHFEYRSRSNRRLSAELVSDRLAPMIDAGTPVILLGDLNAMPSSRTVEILSDTGLHFGKTSGATYHLNAGLNLFGPIDHIATANGVGLMGNPVVIRDRFAGEWPSDHYPVTADIMLPE